LETSAIELVSAQGKVIREAAVVTYVYPESPAAAAGFVVGEIVTRLNPHDVTDDRELQRTTSTAGADSTVVLEGVHGRRNTPLAVTLGKQPGPRAFPPAGTQYARDGRRDLGMEGRIDSVRTEILRL